MNIKIGLLLTLCGLVLGLSLVACDQQADTSMVSGGQIPKRSYDPQVLAMGKQVFAKNCARCHGEQAQGHAQWRKPGPDGKYPPPPLNGTGHAWHHSRSILKDVIQNGSKDQFGNMPSMKDVINDKEIEAVISWFQSLWPDQVYAAWYEMQQRGQ